MRILSDGSMDYCRWSAKDPSPINIAQVSPDQFFVQHMSGIRQQMLQGQPVQSCNQCHHMEQHGKISGRQRQLLKTGIRLEQFEKTVQSSPWAGTFASAEFTQLPQDWQIDLGNLCNSGCVFCSPNSSSRLAAEYVNLGLISQMPAANWTHDDQLLDKFMAVLRRTRHVRYIHFIGGETVITPAFKTILQALIDAGLHTTATVGFTTNLISWDPEVVDLLTQFHGVNLGMSLEALHPVNEYVRWPADQSLVETTLASWLDVARTNNWLIQLRTTPTVLSISHLLTVYEFAWQNNVAIESCNFLNRPEFMRPSVLPIPYRQTLIDQWQSWISQHQFCDDVVVNSRSPAVTRAAIVQDLQSYVNYLSQEPDESWRLPNLVSRLKLLEKSRNNSILSYLPEYEELFRTAGY